MIRFIKFLATGVVLVALAAWASASEVVWQTPVTIAGGSDVNTQGTQVYGRSYNIASGATGIVNGVNFGYNTGLWSVTYSEPSAQGQFDSLIGSQTIAAPDASNYKAILGLTRYWNNNTTTPTTINFGNLVVGRTYLFQVWVCDYRNFNLARTETVVGSGGNVNTPTLKFLDIGLTNNPGAAHGQFVTGTWTAISDTMAFTFTPNQGVNLSAMQLRDITAPVSGGPGLVNVGPSASFNSVALTTDALSIFRLGGGSDDFARILQIDGLTLTAGSAPKHLIQISQQGPIAPGIYPLIDYAGAIGGLGFAGLELGSLGRLTGYLVNDSVNATISLVITGGRTGDLSWTGASGGAWDASTNNWMWNDGTDLASAFYNGDTVRLDDSASTGMLTLTGSIEPAEVVVDNTDLPYTVTGSGGISGPTRLTKSGSGILTINNPNTHTGETAIFDGTLRIASGGSLGGGAINNFGTLELDRDDALTFPNIIKGTGNLTKTGAGTVTLTAANTYTGNSAVNGGTLRLSQACFANGSTVSIAANAILNLNFSGSDSIAALFIGDVPQPAGTYTSSNSGGRITGSGSLVVTGGVSYAAWESHYGIPGVGAGADSDGDGITNGMEFALGGNPCDSSSESTALLPVATVDGSFLTFSYRRTANSVGRSNTAADYSFDLTTWTPAVHGSLGVTITTTPDHYAAGIDQVTVAIPTSLALDGRLFTRLRTSVP